MKRMGDSTRPSPSSGNMTSRDMSYTNLAAMAEQFETYQRVLPAGGTKAEDSQATYGQAMELINTGLRLDATTPLEAISYYQRGGDMLSRVLESVRAPCRRLSGGAGAEPVPDRLLPARSPAAPGHAGPSLRLPVIRGKSRRRHPTQHRWARTGITAAPALAAFSFCTGGC